MTIIPHTATRGQETIQMISIVSMVKKQYN